MKKNIFMNSMAAALLTGVVAMGSLTSCSSDDNAVETKPEVKPGAFTYSISVPASLNSDETRAVTFDAGGSSSSTFFESGDKVYVYKGTFSEPEWSTAAPLTVTPESNTQMASLNGEVTFETTPAVGDEIHLIYNPNAFDGTPNNLFNYTDQDGSAASASDHDFAEAVMVITAINGGEITLAQKASTDLEYAAFNSLQSMFRQRLSFKTVNGNYITSMPQIVSLTIECENKLCTTVRPGGSVANALTITNPQITSEGDIYLALHFVSNATSPLVLTATDANGNVYVCSKNAPEIGFVNYKYYHGNAVMQAQLYAGAISGEFSVSSTKKVYFSQGNLQASTSNKGTSWTWAFAEHQWDKIGGKDQSSSGTQTGNNYINGNGTLSANGTVDLFGWSTSATHLGIHNSTNNNDYSGNFVDWGSAEEVSDCIGTGWRTLTRTEWEYLLCPDSKIAHRNTTSGMLYYKAQVNGVNGLIVFPDNWSTSYHTLTASNVNNNAISFESTKITESVWNTDFASHGAVFLPVAGQRHVNNNYVEYPNGRGHYWSSTPYETGTAYRLYFTGSSDDWSYGVSSSRRFGYSVRLVRDAN